MAPKIQHKRSAVAGKAPLPADLDYGEIGVNYEASDPALYIKDTANAVRKIGSQPDASETTKGIVELATAAETTTGTDNTRAVHPAGLKVELDKKAPLASPALTGVPTAPTAAAGTNTTQVATTEFVTAAVAVENLWDRTGTVVSPTNAGDDITTTGDVNGAAGTFTADVTVGGNTTLSAAGAITTPAVSLDPGSTGSPLVRDSAGRLLVGTSSTAETTTAVLQGRPGDPSGAGTLTLQGGYTGGVGDTSLYGEIAFSASTGKVAQISGLGVPRTNGTPGDLRFSTTPDGTTTPVERMRIGSDGSLLLGTTAVTPASGGISFRPNLPDGSNRYPRISLDSNSPSADIFVFTHAGTPVGRINITNTATAYVTSSDYRLKENVTPFVDAVARLQKLKPCRFNFIVDPDTTVDGFIAHEAQEVVPESVFGRKDAVDDNGDPFYQGIDQSKLVPLLTAALQEAVARIETLEAKVAALESK